MLVYTVAPFEARLGFFPLIMSGLKKRALIGSFQEYLNATIADCISNRVASDLFSGGSDDAHHHHEIGEPVSGPAAEPGHFPLSKSRANRDWSFQAKEFRFQLHVRDTFMAQAGRSVKWSTARKSCVFRTPSCC